ncbi:MAG: LptF/LptG family permease [Bryobacteraceae bacterium]
MGILSRTIFREIVSSALLGTVLFSFVLFLQKIGKLFELLVLGSASAETVAYLFLLVLPPVLTFTIPIGVLVGVLIGLSRMASDGEITAMRAAGVASRHVIYPVLLFSVLATGVAGAASLWLTPLATQETYRILNQLVAAQLTAEIQPRVFEEQFPSTILYVGDVIPSDPVRWRNVFMADLTPPEERRTGTREQGGEGPRITVASEAIAVPDVARNRIQLLMLEGSSHEVGADPGEYYSATFRKRDQVLEAKDRDELKAAGYTAEDTRVLYETEAAKSVEARIELHRRFALPLACVLLAMVGVPLGVSSRKGGKSVAFVLTVLFALFYFMGLISLIGLAKQGTLPAPLAVWTPNGVFALAGLILLVRLDRPGDPDWVGRVLGTMQYGWSRLRGRIPAGGVPKGGVGAGRGRWLVLPQVVDAYVLRLFLFYFVTLLGSFVLMTHVFTFFELLGDIVRNKIAMSRVITYLFFLTPKLIYDSTPMSVLVAVLVTFGVLGKNNEVTAFKACGVSLHRLAMPVLFLSLGFSGALFAFDHYIVADANRIQDAIRNEIKGRPVQTYLRPDRKWIFGSESRIYYYRYFDPAESLMVGVYVFELDPQTFRLRRHIAAERARWEPGLNTWIFQNGWVRDVNGIRDKYRNFHGETATFPELDEPPSYFLKEVKQDKQMNFHQLASYIEELKQSGFDTVRLQVQFHKKFSVPLFALIMAMISVPFAFMAGNRGAMAGVGISFGIAIAYWAISQLFEQVGNVNQLPAALAAWSPDALFSMAGLYLLARMRT